MTYATQNDLVTRYGIGLLVELTDRAEEPTGEIDAQVVEKAASGTDALIDGYLQGRYVLPMSATPPLVRELAEAITIYKLHRYTPSEKIVDEHKAALVTLDKVAKGVVRLPIAGVEPAVKPGKGVRVTDRERPLTAASLKGFI